jgi:predicted nucleic acid-binding protein
VWSGGKHRAPSIPDLIVAAAGELAGLCVLHLDKDFDLIADVTGQPVERLRA